MLKSAAENIYPVEVENCLKLHPAVADCRGDRRARRHVGAGGEGDRRAAPTAPTATADEFIEHCRERIASYKKPRTVEFVDALPRRGFAVDYDALDAQFGGGGYPGGTTRSA